MAYVTLAEVQQWLEPTKLDLTAVDSDLESTAKEIVFSRVSAKYDVSTWASDVTTPSLIRKLLSLYIAAWTYKRQYSEDEDQVNEYAKSLEDMANDILAGIADGIIILDGATELVGASPSASFYPKDAQDLDVDNARKFTMGKVF